MAHTLPSNLRAMLASLSGLDALMFTAGVGEHAAQVRRAACEAFAFKGPKLDLEKNAQSRLIEILRLLTQPCECWLFIPKKIGKSPANAGN